MSDDERHLWEEHLARLLREREEARTEAARLRELSDSLIEDRAATRRGRRGACSPTPRPRGSAPTVSRPPMRGACTERSARWLTSRARSSASCARWATGRATTITCTCAPPCATWSMESGGEGAGDDRQR